MQNRIGDHPRLCGNNRALSEQRSPTRGSPPPVREQPNSAMFTVISIRITPACAGTTFL